MRKATRLDKFKQLIAESKTREDICNTLSISIATYYNYYNECNISIPEKPEKTMTISDIRDIRTKVLRYKRDTRDYLSGVPVTFDSNLPIGVLHLGDAHMDNDGTDLELLEEDISLLRNTEGLYGGNVGDTTDNWVGFLKKLYANSHTTEVEAEELVKHYLSDVTWLYTILGNHDLWNGREWIIKNNVGDSVIGEDIRLILRFPNDTTVTLRARHDFPGTSMYNPAHGIVKEAMLNCSDDIMIQGHLHTLADCKVVNSMEQTISHCLTVGSYKKVDSYQVSLGLPDKNLTPSMVTTIDPNLPQGHVDRIKVFYDTKVGVDYLKYLRSKYGKS